MITIFKLNILALILQTIRGGMSQHIPPLGTTRRPWLKSYGHCGSAPGSIHWKSHCSEQEGTSCYTCTGYCQCTVFVPAHHRATPLPMSTSSLDRHCSGTGKTTSFCIFKTIKQTHPSAQSFIFILMQLFSPGESDRPLSSC